MKLQITLFLIAFYSIFQAQNLFSNGDFESYSTCPSGLGQINYLDNVQGCTVTPDYFNSSCNYLPSSSSGSTYCSMNAEASIPSGSGFIGFFGGLFNSTSYQYESLIITLNTSTIQGQDYDIDFEMFTTDRPYGPCYGTAIGDCIDFGFYFYNSSSPPNCPAGPTFPINSPPHPAPHVSMGCGNISIGSWSHHSLSFTANASFDRVLVYFYPNSLTGTSGCTSGTGKFYMDDLCIKPSGGSCSSCNYALDAGIDQTICDGSDVNLDAAANGGILSTFWSTSGDGTFGNPYSLSTTYTPGANDISSGSTVITITSDDPGSPCSIVSDQFILTIGTTQNTTIAPIDDLCINSNNIFLNSASPGGIWSGNGIIDNTVGEFSPASAGVGSWSISYSIGNPCPSSSSTTIQVSASLDPTFSYDTNYICNELNNPTPNIYGDNNGIFNIDNEGHIDSVSGMIDLTLTSPGTYIITYQFNDQCSTNFSDTIEICSQIEDTVEQEILPHLLIPNIFTPNGDHINDEFFVTQFGISQIKTTIYNRWGTIIYSNELEIFNNQEDVILWEGQNNNNATVNTGVYYYILNYRDIYMNEHEVTGFIHLLY